MGLYVCFKVLSLTVALGLAPLKIDLENLSLCIIYIKYACKHAPYLPLYYFCKHAPYLPPPLYDIYQVYIHGMSSYVRIPYIVSKACVTWTRYACKQILHTWAKVFFTLLSHGILETKVTLPEIGNYCLR